MKGIIWAFWWMGLGGGFLALGQTGPSTPPVKKQARKAYDEATLAYMQRDWEGAWTQVNLALRRDSTYFDAWMLMAQLAQEKERWSEAARALERGYDLQPDGFPAGRIQWVKALYRSGQYAAASEAWSLVQARPEWSQTRRNPEEAAREAARWDALGQQVSFAREALRNPVEWNAMPLPGNVNTPDPEYHPALTLDGQTLIYTRLVGGSVGGRSTDQQLRVQEDFFLAQWNQASKSWMEVSPLRGINSPGNEGAPALRGDGRRLIFTACELPRTGYGERQGVGSCDLFEAYWDPIVGSFDSGVNLGAPNTPGWESQPSLSADGRLLVFVRGTRNTDGSRGQDLFFSEWTEAGKWSPARPLAGKVNTEGNEENPVLHPDGRTLYFASDGHPGMGGMDLFVSRLQEDGTWGEVVNLGYPINTLAHENSLVVGPDGRMAIFATDREHPGESDLWSMTLPEWALARPIWAWKGRVRDAVNGLPIEADVIIMHPDGTRWAQMESDAVDGQFVLPVAPESDWVFQVEEPGYAFFSMRHQGTASEKTHAEDLDLLLQPLIPGTTFALRDIRFATGSALLEAGFQPDLAGLVQLLQTHPSLRVKLVGHTDATGTAKDNLTLSQSRSKAVRQFLVDQGIDGARIEWEGRGATQPVAGNDTPEGRAANRRTEVVVLE
jgi:outer membrane protein OmpA-like peptidoglycan-associated protein